MQINTFKIEKEENDKLLEGQNSLQDKIVEDQKSHVLKNVILFI